jgi:hypothetical protein
MSVSDSPSDRLTNRVDFTHALNELVGHAVDNDINVRGGYRVENDEWAHDLGVEIYYVVSKD